MWRLAITQTKTHLSFLMCRPLKLAERENERCDWRIDIKKPKNVHSQLQNDDFLFRMMAALHEKLPLREFAEHEEFNVRTEPRIKSVLLENPPPLVRGIVSFEEGTGRLIITPTSQFRLSTGSESGWLVPSASMESRWLAMEDVLREAGDEPTEPPPPEPEIITAFEIQPPISTSAKTTASGKNQSEDHLREGGSQPKKRPPLQMNELPPTPQPSLKPLAKSAKSKAIDSKKTSVFAHDSVAPPDDREVIKLKGAESENGTNDAGGLLSSVWKDLWLGGWHTSFDISGLPVPESERTRLPSVQSYSFSGWHPLWRYIAIGGQIRQTYENESLDLRISLPGSALTQNAQGSRKTTLLSGSLVGTTDLTEYRGQFELRGGLVSLNESWSYDRKKSTFEIWSPSGRGQFVEPSALIQPQHNSDGPTARASYGFYSFNGASGSQWSVESGWQWAFDSASNKFWKMQFSNLQGYLGLKRGKISNTGDTTHADGIGTILLNSFSLGLRLNIDDPNGL